MSAVELETVEGIYRLVGEHAAWETLRRYTAFVRYSVYGLDSIEEIDVDAGSEDEARRVAEAALARDYEPGGSIAGLEERFGWYL